MNRVAVCHTHGIGNVTVRGRQPAMRPAAACANNASSCSDHSRSTSAALLSAMILLSGSPMAPFVPPASAAIAGPVRVVDGDTLVIGTERIRMYGMDAPESKQLCKDGAGKDYMCGVKSKEALAAKIGGQPVSCNVKNKDQYGRSVAECFLPNGTNLNAWLVESGNAVAYRQFGKEFIPLEEEARGSRRGIWNGSFTMPAEWRKQQKTGGTPIATLPYAPALATTLTNGSGGVPTAQPIPSGICPPGAPVIKGNIGSKGDKIYHMPGTGQYDWVKIEVAKGEKWFCSEAEAKSSGFRGAGKQ